MTYAEHISNLKHALKEVSNESNYSDSLLYSLWKQGRAKFLTQKAKKKDHIARTNWYTFCMELEIGKSHDCSCVPVGCDVLKSKYVLPGVIASRMGEKLQILTLDGTPISYRTENERKTDIYDPIKCDDLGYMIFNQKVIIWDKGNELKGFQARGIWSDPLEWQDIQLCTDSNPCVDVYSMDSGLTEDDEALIIEYIITREYGSALQRPSDASFDSNPEIR